MDTVIVSNGQFYSHYPKNIAKGTVDAEAVLVRLDSEWDNLTVRIHWLNVESGVEKVVLLERDHPNTIPWEVLDDLSELRMGLDGMDGGTIVKPTVWLTYGYVVDGVDPEAGDDPQPPTPSWEQQMVALAEAAANAAKAAKETADNLQASAEAGEFNGDPGPEGPPGKSPIIRNGTWWIWNNDTQDYTDTGVIASGGGGGGVTSYNDLSDRPRIGGVPLEGDKTAQDLGLQPKGDYATTDSIPKKLPNPNPLIIKGQTYDGSQTVKVEVSDGKTPVKGVDYFTEAEIQDVAKLAAALVPGDSAPYDLLYSATVEDPDTMEVLVVAEKPIKSIAVYAITPADDMQYSLQCYARINNSGANQIIFGIGNLFQTSNNKGVVFFEKEKKLGLYMQKSAKKKCLHGIAEL